MRNGESTSEGADPDQRRLVAVATSDPFAPSTFSGLSARLFAAVAAEGVEVTPMSSRVVRPSDVLRGAVDPIALVRRPSRQRPRVRPRWFWSRGAHEAMSRRLDERLARQPAPVRMLQIGTHVRSSLAHVGQYCWTDCTIPQAVAAGEFSISRAPAAIIDEAIAVQRGVFEACTRILLPSQWVADSVIGDLGIDPARIEVVGAGANISRGRARLLDCERPYVLFVGADWEQKGGPLVLDAFRRARAAVASARLVVVGCSPSLAEPGVEVIGRIDRTTAAGDDQMQALYAGASCFCIASRFDAFPNVLLEAGVLGVPVVTTAEGSRPEVVVDGQTGLLARDRDPAELGVLLARLLGDADEVARLGVNAERWCNERYTWPVVGAHIVRTLAYP